MEETNKKKGRLAPRMIIMIIVLIIIFGGIFGFDLLRSILIKRYFAHFQLPPVAVSTTKSVVQTWQPMINAIGNIVAINNVNVTSQQSGLVTGIYFTSGQYVHKGDLLVKIDDSTDQQDLKNYQAQLNLSQINYVQQSVLFKKRANAETDLDNAVATLKQNQALVDKTKAVIAQKNIVAPFDGKIGIRQVSLGQFLSAGTAVASLQSVDPIYVQFNMPEQFLKNLYLGQPIQFTVSNFPNETFTAKIDAIDSNVNTSTRNILVEATAPNPQGHLFPGVFADVNVILPQKNNVVTVPQTAIAYTLYGDTIFVVKQEGVDKQGKPILRVRQRYVKIGEQRGNIIQILDGLQAGEEVVTSGQLKLQEGMQVVINNDVAMPSMSKEYLKTHNE